MSLATNLLDLVTAIGTEFKTTKADYNAKVGSVPALITTDKTNLVAAINEVKGSLAGAGAVINDTAPSTTSVFSSTKTQATITAAVNALVAGAPIALDTLHELATALGDDANYAATITTALGTKVPTTRLVNGHALSADAVLVLGDIADAQSALAIGNTATNFAAAFATALV